MDMSEYTSGKFLRVADLKEGGSIKATIVSIEINDKFNKPDVELSDGSILSCNATNCGILIRAYGSSSDDWLNKEIELFVDTVDFKGEPKETIKVRPISPPPEKKAPAKKKSRKEDFDDEVIL